MSETKDSQKVPAIEVTRYDRTMKRIDQAKVEVHAMIERQNRKETVFRRTVPVQPDDSDVLLLEVLDEAAYALRELKEWNGVIEDRLINHELKLRAIEHVVRLDLPAEKLHRKVSHLENLPAAPIIWSDAKTARHLIAVLKGEADLADDRSRRLLEQYEKFVSKHEAI